MDAEVSPTAPKGANSESMGKLLDLLTAVKWDLKQGLSDGAAAPEELARNIGRMFEDIDASVSKLREIIREQGLPV